MPVTTPKPNKSLVDYFADSGDRTVYLRDHQEQTLRAYLYVAPTSRVALSGAVELTEFRQNAKESQFEPVELDELRVPITARYFHPAGYFGELGGTYIRQEIKRMAVASEQDYDNESDGFFSADAVVGYRLLSNRMVVSVEGRNLLDNNVRYEDASFRTPEIANLDEQPDPSLFDSRTFLARMTVRF